MLLRPKKQNLWNRQYFDLLSVTLSLVVSSSLLDFSVMWLILRSIKMEISSAIAKTNEKTQE